jgi:hypothetical protein
MKRTSRRSFIEGALSVLAGIATAAPARADSYSGEVPYSEIPAPYAEHIEPFRAKFFRSGESIMLLAHNGTLVFCNPKIDDQRLISLNPENRFGNKDGLLIFGGKANYVKVINGEYTYDYETDKLLMTTCCRGPEPTADQIRRAHKEFDRLVKSPEFKQMIEAAKKMSYNQIVLPPTQNLG